MKIKNRNKMTIDKYTREVLRTEGDCYLGSTVDEENDLGDGSARILHGLLGLSGEAGECIDIYKKFLFQGHDLDREHLAEELGDVAWYLVLCADSIGYSLTDIFEMNVKKLNERYPNGFDSERSINRDGDKKDR